MATAQKQLTPEQKKVEEKMQEMIAHAKVDWHKGPILLPENKEGLKMTYAAARAVLRRQERYEEELVEIKERFEDFPLDAALAFHKAMARTYGWVNAEAIRSFFGVELPEMVSIPTGPYTNELIPIGRFSLPGIEDGSVDIRIIMPRGQKAFLLVEATVKRKYEAEIRDLLKLAKLILKDESIYRGKAFKVRFTDDDGEDEPMPVVSFMDVSRVKRENLILNHYTARDVAARIWTPLERAKEVKAAGVKLKRGVLLAGPYGTGKTLTAYVTAKIAVENGCTFIYCEKAADLARTLRVAAQYAAEDKPAVLFCEDLDRVTSGKRDARHDELLNILDGVDTKEAEVMVVFTTNHPEAIGEAFLRPGRIDVVLPIPVPDAEAAEKLVRLYAGNSLEKGDQLVGVGEALQGRIPAVIEEAVATAKLFAVQDHGNTIIRADDLLSAAASMEAQINYLAPPKVDSVELAHTEIVEGVTRLFGPNSAMKASAPARR